MTGPNYRILLAGASGAIGRRLTPLLLEAGHHVTGTTRSADKADMLRSLGAEPLIVDVFDASALLDAVVAARPEIVIHQLTDLPRASDPKGMVECIRRTARLRNEGTSNLVAASLLAGSRRIIAQSVGWLYEAGPKPHTENHPLDLNAEGNRAVSVDGIEALEDQILGSPPLEGIVLRYGQIYGPGTGADQPSGASPLHVDAAAYAALLAIDKAAAGGIYNIAEPNPHIATDKARMELGWDSGFRLEI